MQHITKYMTPRLILLIIMLSLLGACNIRDLNDLDEIAKNHAVRLARMEKMLIEARRQIQLIHKLLVEYDGRLTVLSTEEKNDGLYIHFSDGDTICLNSAQIPAVSLSLQNTWMINGVDTRISCEGIDASGDVIAPQIRINEGKWEISVDGGNTWRNTGIQLQGKDGEDGEAARIAIGANGNWYVNGRDLRVPALGADGKKTSAPLVEIRENGDGTANWWIKNGSEEWKNTGVLAVGKDGGTGEEGGAAPYVKSVSVSGRKISFIFSDNIPGKKPVTNTITVDRQVSASYTIFEDGVWVVLPSKPFAIPIGGIRTINIKLQNPPASSSFGWKIILPDGFDFLGLSSSDRKTFELKVFVNKTVTEYRSGLVFLTIMLAGDEYETIVPVSTQLYQIDISRLTFADSYVYEVFNDADEKIAEICREYINDGSPGGKQAAVIYPYNNTTLRYGTGYVTGLGGTVDHTTGKYTPGGDYTPGRKDIYFLSAHIFMLNIQPYMYVTPLSDRKFISEKAVDAQGNKYKIVKIGPQYWMAENLKVGCTTEGQPFPMITDPAAWAEPGKKAYCYYNNDQVAGKTTYGALYSGSLVAADMLAPAGWRIPDTEDWKMLEIFLGMPQGIVDNEGWRGTYEGRKLKSKNGWMGEGNGTDITGFGALPGGFRLPAGFAGLGEEGGWWALNRVDRSLRVWRLSAAAQNTKNTSALGQDGYSVRCIRNNKNKQ